MRSAEMSKKKELQAEGFTIKSFMSNAVVAGPPNTGIFHEQPAKSRVFRNCYNEGHLPVQVDYNKTRIGIAWKVDIEQLDYSHYLPLFFEGLCETDPLLELFACQGIHEMLKCGGSKILPVIPQLIQPICNALNTRNDQVMCNTMRALQQLVQSADKVGEALVPYFRRILTVFNIFKNKRKNLGGNIGYGQQSIASMIQETLMMFERYGGRDAFANIKYLVPTYQSCIKH